MIKIDSPEIKKYGFQLGEKHIIEIEASSEEEALLILCKRHFSFISVKGKIELLGELAISSKTYSKNEVKKE